MSYMSNRIIRCGIASVVVVWAGIPSVVGAQQLPTPWTLVGSATSEYLATIDKSVKRSGNASAHLASRVRETSGFAALSQTVSAEAFRGQRIRIRMYSRTRNLVSGSSYLYVSVRGLATDANAYANSQSRAVKGSTADWVLDTLSVMVPTNAETISFGSIVDGSGEVWLDDAAVTVDDATSPVTITDGGFETTAQFAGQANSVPLIAAKAATDRGLDAMMAFARLTGYVRFFYPADTILATNWAYFTTEGLPIAERATTTDSLVRTLTALFKGMAPDVTVYASNSPPPIVAATRPADTTGLGVAFWRHVGVGLPTSTMPRERNIYSSRRVVLPLDNGSLPNGANDPLRPVRVDLGGGVSAVVPTALWMRLPADSALRAAQPRVVGVQGLSLNNRSVRLAAIADLWMTMQHFYPYFDVVQTDWARELRMGLARAAAEELPSQFDVTLKRMVASLHDGHGNAYRSRPLSGRLPIVFRWAEGQVVVATVSDTSTTMARRGDIVLEIDGVSVQKLVADGEALISSATVQWARFNAVDRLGLANDGAVMQLRVRSAGVANAPIRNVTATAKAVRTAGDMPSEVRPEKIAELSPGVMYVDMSRINDADFAAVRPKLLSATAIVFDLRGYPSFNTVSLLRQLTDSVIRSAHFESPLTQRPDRAGVTYTDGAWMLQPDKPRISASTYFLTDGRAISYAESTMGVVETYKLGVIVGSATAGTNGNINSFVLPGGSTVVFTGMRVRKRDGSPHHGVGIQPTVRVEPTTKGIYDGHDEVLEKALALIAQRTARP